MSLPSSMAEFCTTWSLAAKGLLIGDLREHEKKMKDKFREIYEAEQKQHAKIWFYQTSW